MIDFFDVCEERLKVEDSWGKREVGKETKMHYSICFFCHSLLTALSQYVWYTGRETLMFMHSTACMSVTKIFLPSFHQLRWWLQNSILWPSECGVTFIYITICLAPFSCLQKGEFLSRYHYAKW